MTSYLYLFSLLSGRHTFVKLANFFMFHLLSFNGDKMPGRSLPVSGPAYLKILVEIPMKILEA